MTLRLGISRAALTAVALFGAALPALAQEPGLEGTLAPMAHDLSAVGMFMAADWVVKGVMIGLALASVVTWAVFLMKTLEIGRAKRQVAGALRIVSKAPTLGEAEKALGSRAGAGAAMVKAAVDEARQSSPAISSAGGEGLKERVSSRLGRIEANAGRNLSKGTGILASVGSVAPFVGLFGTVWGIMNSFIGIAEAQTSNLAIVAPGIAEALLATALGLVAAIPAVVFYNIFARSIVGYRASLADVASGVERLVSRDLDYRRFTGTREAAE
ncbi:tonB-system energizer ExbB [Aliihoeflea sp. PC F10.4]